MDCLIAHSNVNLALCSGLLYYHHLKAVLCEAPPKKLNKIFLILAFTQNDEEREDELDFPLFYKENCVHFRKLYTQAQQRYIITM